MKLVHIKIWAWFLAVLLSFVTISAEADPLTLNYGNRHVDLAPYYFDFPYSIGEASLKQKKIFYTKDERGGGSYLYVQDWDPDSLIKFDAAHGIRVTDIDINKINFWGRKYNAVLGGLGHAANRRNTAARSCGRNRRR